MVAWATSKEIAVNDCIELRFKRYLLTGMAVPDGEGFGALLIIRLPSGDQLATGLLNHFENPHAAKQFAVEYGMSQLDSYSAVDERIGLTAECDQRK